MTYVSSSCFPIKNIEKLLDFAKKNNFINLELTGSLEYNDDIFKVVKDTSSDFNFLIHNYFPPQKEPLVINLASANETIREKSLNHCRQAMKICEDLKIPFYSVHAGFLVDLSPNDLGAKQTEQPRTSRAEGLKNFIEPINHLLTETQIDLLVENNVNSQENLVNGKNELYLNP